MPKTHYGWLPGIAVVVASAAVLGGASLMDAQQEAKKPSLEIFTGSVVYDDTVVVEPGKERADRVNVIIERWSTEQERQALIQAYDKGGAKGLLSALQKTEPVGVLRTTLSRSWDLHYAIQEPRADGGRRIIVGTDRLINHWEVNSQKKASYPFTLVELHLDKDDQGDGRISLGTQINRSKDSKSLELEFYDAAPVRLRDVRKQKN